MTLNKIIWELESAKENALAVYEANRDNHSTVQSVAFDSGRYNGLKEALEIVSGMRRVPE